MKLPLHSSHLKRYRDIARLVFKYGRSDMVHKLGLDEALSDDADAAPRESKAPRPEELADDLEKLGPTYVKLGQLLSSRADLLPEAYLKALSRLQDKVKPFPFEDVERIVLHELGVRISKGFSHFDAEPLAAASLGQVHRAALRDGRPVVVKVQRPGIRPQIAEDLEALEELAIFFDEHTRIGKRFQFLSIFEEFRRSLIQELDYNREASNLTALAENLRDFDLILVPLPVPDYTTRSVLTMDYVRGMKITALSPLVRLELNGEVLAGQLFHAYLKQVLVDGQFHADPHPGNIFLTDDGRVALLDLGMVGNIAPNMQSHLIKLLMAISEGDSESAADLAIRISDTAEDFNEKEFRREVAYLVAQQRESTLQEVNVGSSLLNLSRHAGRNGLMVPTELTLLGKTLLQLEEIGHALAPDFNPNAAIRHHVSRIMNQHLRREFTPSKMLGSVLEMKDFLGHLPSRLNRILDAVTNSELEVKVRAVDTSLLLAMFQKVANRITAGLVLAALIVGASLMMHVESSFQILGYPGLAIICFVLAAGGGFYLVFSIFFQDRRDRKKPPH